MDVIEHGDVWEVLERAKQAGKIRHYGVSINTIEEIRSRGGHDFLTMRTDVASASGDSSPGSTCGPNGSSSECSRRAVAG